MSGRRVAVTGIGLVSALGTTREAVWDGLVRGRCGIGDLTLFDAAGYRSTKAAEIPAYQRDPAFSEKAWRRLSRSDQIAVIASREALADSGVLDASLPRDRIGVILGSGTADLMRNEEWFADMRRRGVRRAPPSKIFGSLPEHPVRRRGDLFRIRRAEVIRAVGLFVRHRGDRLRGRRDCCPGNSTRRSPARATCSAG